MAQADLFQDPTPQPSKQGVDHASHERQRAHHLLSQVQDAQTIPWTPIMAGIYIMMFGKSLASLPEEEASTLKRQFDAEIARLRAASPAGCIEPFREPSTQL